MKRISIVLITYYVVCFCSLELQAEDSIFSNLIIDTFGDLVIGGRLDDINVQFQYGIPDDFVTATSTGAGAGVTGVDSMAVLSSGTGSTGSVSLTSHRSLIYVPGHHGFIFFTALFTNTDVGTSTQWIGLFDDTDGWAVGLSGTTFSILYRRSGVDTIISQSAFNTDPLNGTGASGMTIDPTKLNVFRLGYGWLGGATISFSILREDGEWIQFHEIERPNSATGPSVINPVLPMKAEIKNVGNTGSIDLKTASWNAGRVGPRSPYYARTFSRLLIDSNLKPATDSPLITIKNKTEFRGKTNRTEVNLVYVGVSNDNSRSRFRIVKNPTLAGITGAGDFQDVDTDHSVIQYVFLTGSGGSSAGFPTYATGSGQSALTILLDIGGQENMFLKGNNFIVKLLPGESLSLIGNKIGAGTEVDSTMVWEEIF